MIVVVDQAGHPSVARVARAAATAGAVVELVARIRDDAAGDQRVRSLAEAGVGHVATLRQPASASSALLDAEDLDLALRYLGEATTIVLVGPRDARSLQVVVDAAGWSQGHLIIVLPAGAVAPGSLPEGSFVLEAPATDPEGAFATLVGTFAAGLERGIDPAEALAAAGATTPGPPRSRGAR